MNEEAVRLALLVAERTRERDEARTALGAHIAATQGKLEAQVKTAPGAALEQRHEPGSLADQTPWEG